MFPFPGTSFSQPSQSQQSQSRPVPSYSQEVVIDVEDEDEMGHDDLDDEVYFGQLRGNIVGIQYYRGTVNEPRHEKTGLRGAGPVLTQTSV